MRYSIKVATVALVCLTLTVVGGVMASGLPDSIDVHVVGLAEDGVSLTLASDSTADGTGAAGGAPEVMLHNRTGGTIVAYSLIWKTLDSHGTVLQQSRYSVQVRGILTLEQETSAWEADPAIRAGESRVVPVGANARLMAPGVFEDRLKEVSEAMAAASQVVVVLENVVFRDGRFLGDAKSGFIRSFRAEIISRRMAMEEIVRAHEAGKTVGAARESLNARIISELADDGAVKDASINALDHLSMVYESRPSREIRDGYVEHLRSQLRLPWFTLREEPGQ